jgi:GT2 family glycosyltransferase
MISIVIISKDEASLDGTLTAVTSQVKTIQESAEIVVVDASDRRLDPIRMRHEAQVRWIQFDQPPGATVTIPHQRNVGVHAARGDVIVFIDASCEPHPNWLKQLVARLEQDEEDIVAGLVLSPQGSTGQKWIDRAVYRETKGCDYVRECGAANLAFRRAVFAAVDGYDEGFTYGSDIDFSWRAVDAGYRIRWAPEAVIRHDWGTWRRQLRRHYGYGKARVRLYRKHPARFKQVLRHDLTVVAYPVFLLGLPLTLIFPFYPALLLIPAWRSHSDGALSVLNHLAFGITFGAGVLTELFIS